MSRATQYDRWIANDLLVPLFLQCRCLDGNGAKLRRVKCFTCSVASAMQYILLIWGVHQHL